MEGPLIMGSIEVIDKPLSRSRADDAVRGREIDEKRGAYLAAVAQEVWIVDPEGETVAFHGPDGALAASRFDIDLSGLFAR